MRVVESGWGQAGLLFRGAGKSREWELEEIGERPMQCFGILGDGSRAQGHMGSQDSLEVPSSLQTA